MVQYRYRILAAILFYLSLFFVRNQIRLDLGFDWPKALDAGFRLGMLFDLVVALIPVALWRIFHSVLFIPGRATWSILVFLIWISTIANFAYFRFFNTPMPFWVVTAQSGDAIALQGSYFSLLTTVSIGMSLLSLIGALVIVNFKLTDFWKSVSDIEGVAKRGIGFTAGLCVLVLTLLLRQSPVWFKHIHVGQLHMGTIINSHVLQFWWDENFAPLERGRLDKVRKRLSVNSKEYSKEIGSVLGAYQNFELKADGVQITGPESLDPYPLVRSLDADPSESRSLREKLGLPLDGPINVVYLFLESVRAYEMNHPQKGPLLWPRVNQVLKERGIYFTQAYTSSFEAGQTVRGQFSTNCSMLPNLNGVATYINYPSLRINCIQGVLKENGYNTYWINSYKKNFHNKVVFEAIHGTDHFYDESHFLSKGITQKTGAWGLADEPFLQETINILENAQKEGKPFFANVLTISTHFPFEFSGEIEVPKEYQEIKKTQKKYYNFLGLNRYLDESLGKFFDRFFESSLADDTLIVMLADHSNYIQPKEEQITDIQYKELEFRIPVALITKNLKPQVIRRPVHQVDVTPTVAAIVGVKGESAWLGKNMLRGGSSPWVYSEYMMPHYRYGDTACYSLLNWKRTKCWKIGPDQDPMFDQNLIESPKNAKMDQFFRSVIQATTEAISLNLLFPPQEFARAK